MCHAGGFRQLELKPLRGQNRGPRRWRASVHMRTPRDYKRFVKCTMSYALSCSQSLASTGIKLSFELCVFWLQQLSVILGSNTACYRCS